MARYFKFHTLDDIRAECERLGLDIEFREDLTPLFRPVQIGPLRAGNSLGIQPMEGCDGTLDGRPDELTFRRYQRFGAGGAKLIWGEAAAVVPEGRANPRQLLVSEGTAGDLERILNVCRQAHREACGSADDLVRTFSYCTALMRAKHNELGQFATGCPPFDKEVYDPIWKLARRAERR